MQPGWRGGENVDWVKTVLFFSSFDVIFPILCVHFTTNVVLCECKRNLNAWNSLWHFIQPWCLLLWISQSKRLPYFHDSISVGDKKRHRQMCSSRNGEGNIIFWANDTQSIYVASKHYVNILIPFVCRFPSIFYYMYVEKYIYTHNVNHLGKETFPKRKVLLSHVRTTNYSHGWV